MGAIHYRKTIFWQRGLIALVCLLAWICRPDDLAAQPMLGLPKQGDSNHIQIPLYNCNNTNLKYIVEMSTNLANWIPVATNSPSPSNKATIIFRTNTFGFYRLFVFPPLGRFLGVVCKTNFDMKGQNFRADSFDSSNTNYSTMGQYDSTRCEANVKIVGFIITNSPNVGNGNVFGYVCTTSGRTMDLSVDLGPNGSVGDLNWTSNNTAGIEAGHWTSNFNISIPDVPAPNTTGWSTSLPAATGGTNVLNGNYVVSSISNPLYIAGPSTLWVNSSGMISLGVTIATTNNASLKFYVGQTTGTGTTLSWSGQGTHNIPGCASNLQIYGLPSLTSIGFNGNSGWVGTLYAPEANAVFGGSGGSPQDTSGAIVANSISLHGRWNFHYDEHLAQP